MKVEAKDALETPLDLAGRTSGLSGGCWKRRNATEGKSERHGAPGEVDSEGSGSSLSGSPNLWNAVLDSSFSLKSPRCNADLGLSISMPIA